MQGIEHGEIALARHAERHVGAVNAKLVNQNLAAGALVGRGVGHHMFAEFEWPLQCGKPMMRG